MSRVAFIGQPFWSVHLASLVSRHAEPAAAATGVGVPGRLRSTQVVALARCDSIVRVGLRPNARTARGRAFDAAWLGLHLLNPTARRFCYWIGTDVLNAIEDRWAGRTWRSKWIPAERLIHLAGAPWLADELRQLGIEAKPVLFPATLTAPPEPSRLPATFRVLTYVPDGRASFYSGEAINALAQRLPEVAVDVIGGLGAWSRSTPPNVQFHGWQQDLTPFYAQCSVVIRAVRHDAIGSSVREALMWGRHVVYSYPLPHTCHVPFGQTESLIAAVADLYARHCAGSLEPNHAGRAFALAAFDERLLTKRLIDVLTDAS